GASDVRAGHPVAEGEQDLGDAAHANAADAHEVDVLVLLEHQAVLPCCEMLSSTPAENMVMSRAQRQKEMKGTRSPLVGSAPVTPPMFTRVCVARMMVRPRAR